MRGQRSIFVLPLLLSLAGCAAIDKQPYPAEWPAAVAGNQTCHRVNGVYESGALTHTFAHPGRDHLLATTLLPGMVDYGHIDEVLMEYEGTRLRVVGFSADGTALATRMYSAASGLVSCDEGVLVFKADKASSPKRAPDNPMVGITSSEVTFAKAIDGSLVMRMAGSATGLVFLVIPAHAATEHWYRFAPVGEESKTSTPSRITR